MRFRRHPHLGDLVVVGLCQLSPDDAIGRCDPRRPIS